MSHNQLTSTLPAAVFQLEGLLTFVAVSNCLSSSLPADICNATALTTLALDGLRSATSCRRQILPNTASNAYILSGTQDHQVPRCLF